MLAPVPDADALLRAMEHGPGKPEPARTGGIGTARLLARVGTVDPTRLESYRSHGGYRALARAIELGPERVIEEVSASKLLGRPMEFAVGT